MLTLRTLENAAAGKTCIIVGAGGTLKQYGKSLKDFKERNNAITIGINNVTQLLTPDYHLWTNTQRFLTFGRSIQYSSTVLFGQNIQDRIIQKNFNGDYVRVPYTDKQGTPVKYESGRIYGYFRTAGCLAIMIAHVLGVEKLYLAGFDGYTYQSKEDLKTGKSGQHFYGTGYTDSNSWEICEEKDQLVCKALEQLRKVQWFEIITPTVFTKFYNELLKVDISNE